MSALTQTEIIRAVTNDPSLSQTQIIIGDLTVKIVDLEYEDYCVFLAKLKPLLDILFNTLGSSAGLESKAPGLAITDLLTYSAKDIPELALICVKQTLPDVTLEDLKKKAKSPLKLATLVLTQIEHNRVIQEVGDFFVRILPFIPRPKKVQG